MIHGINDRESLARSTPRPDFKLFKGTRKLTRTSRDGKEYQTFGTDLNQFYRLETKNEQIKKQLLKKNLLIEENDGSVMTPSLIILLAYPKIEDSFDTAMELYNASGLIHKCDRETIYLKLEEYKDPYGHIRKKSIAVSEPCPVAGTLEDCPHKCNKSGHLYFFVPELLKIGLIKLGCVGTHSYADIIGISQKLKIYEEQFGSVKNSPFACPQYFNMIPYRLSRQEVAIKRPVMANRKRTGKKSNSTTWAMQLEVEASWLAQWQQWQQLKELRSLGLAPSPSLIKQVYEIPDTVKPLPFVAPDLHSDRLEELPITAEQAQELKELLKQSQWTPHQFLKALANFGCNKVSDLSQNELQQLKKVLRSK